MKTPTTIPNQSSPSNLGAPVAPGTFAPTIKFAAQLAGSAAAKATNHKPWEVSDAEADLVAGQGDEVVREFFPTMQGKWLKLILFIASVLGVYGRRYLSYLETQSKPENPRPAPASEEKTPPPPEVKNGDVFPINPKKVF